MRVRRPVLTALIALALIGGALAVAARVLIAQFDAIEVDQTLDKALQASHALEADLNQLALSTRDYAEWDDAHAYVLSHDAQFLRANFSPASLEGLQVDHMAIVDQDGAVLFSASLDEAQHTITEVIPSSLVTLARQTRERSEELRARSSVQRIVRTDRGLLAFSAVEIRRSDKTHPTGASLLFARYIEDDEVERMRATSRLPAQLALIEASQANGTPAIFAVNEGALITGVALLTDWQGAPVAQIRVPAERAIGALGRRTTKWLMSAIGVLAVACCGVFLFMLRRQRKHWLQRLALQARHERILSSLDESIALIDPATGRIVTGNAALLRALDYSRDDLAQLLVRQVFVDLEAGDLLASDVRKLRECRLRAHDGRLIECEINVTQLTQEEPHLTCIVARDVTQRRLDEQRLYENQTQLAHLTEHDTLTGLPNRQSLQVRLPKLLHRLAAEEGTLALMYIDIDHFKNVNDSRGHGFGDQLLKIIARRLRSDTSAEDIVLRMGGDEFVIVATAAGTPVAVKSMADRIMTAIRAPIVHEGSTVSITASVGVAMYPQDGLDCETLLKHADIALYQAKEKGRDCVKTFSSDMNVQLSEHIAIEQALHRALNTDQIQIAYQPIVDLHTGLLISFEALARWNHPELGPVPPGRFIPVAERSGLIVPLGEQIVHDVIAQLSEWRKAGLTLAPVAVNVAPIQFERTHFATYVHETALAYDVDPQLIAFEVTESALLQDSSKHIVIIDTLRHAGSRVYIDDFGTGFSNLGYLKVLPVDAVKIDQSFVRAIETDENDAAIVSSIISVARQLRLDTIAEGVETAGQAAKLRELGCKFGQGYYFSRPMPASHCRALLKELGDARQLTETVKTRAFRQATG